MGPPTTRVGGPELFSGVYAHGRFSSKAAPKIREPPSEPPLSMQSSALPCALAPPCAISGSCSPASLAADRRRCRDALGVALRHREQTTAKRHRYSGNPGSNPGIVAYVLLVRMIIRANGRDSPVARAIGSDVKGNLSTALFAAGVGLAWVSPWVAYAIYVAVVVQWLVPDRRFVRPESP
jgi:hypothetical protein